MHGKRNSWMIFVASLLCMPCTVVLAQSERIQMDIVATHTVELREVMRIGSLDGTDDAFGQINSVALSRTNHLYVADELNHDIRVYALDGQLVRIIGREGEGPGEFKRPLTISLDDSDSLIAWDDNLGRFSVFDAGGVFRRSFLAPRQWLVNSIRFLPDGNLMLAAYGSSDNWGLHRLDRDGKLINEFAAVAVDSSIYPGFRSSLFGGMADVTDGGDIVYSRKSPYELLFFDANGRHMRTCIGADEWTTVPHDVVEQDAGRLALHWEQFSHSARVFVIEGGLYLNLLVDRPNERTILDIVSPDCRLLCRHALDQMMIVQDVREDCLVATVQADIPQVVVYEFSVHERR